MFQLLSVQLLISPQGQSATPISPSSNAFPFKSSVFKNKCNFFKTLETKGAVIQGEV